MSLTYCQGAGSVGGALGDPSSALGSITFLAFWKELLSPGYFGHGSRRDKPFQSEVTNVHGVPVMHQLL